MSTTIAWVLSVVGIVFMLGAIAANAATLGGYLLRRQRGSMIPILGGLAGSGALLLMPIDVVSTYWWVPLLVDPGCGLWVFMLVWDRARAPRSS